MRRRKRRSWWRDVSRQEWVVGAVVPHHIVFINDSPASCGPTAYATLSGSPPPCLRRVQSHASRDKQQTALHRLYDTLLECPLSSLIPIAQPALPPLTCWAATLLNDKQPNFSCLGGVPESSLLPKSARLKEHSRTP